MSHYSGRHFFTTLIPLYPSVKRIVFALPTSEAMNIRSILQSFLALTIALLGVGNLALLLYSSNANSCCILDATALARRFLLSHSFVDEHAHEVDITVLRYTHSNSQTNLSYYGEKLRSVISHTSS